MKTLDRYLLQLGIGRWILVLFIGTFLILLGDFIGDLGNYLSALASRRWWIFLLYESMRLPGFLLTWLPMSTLAAAMLTAAPLIAQGTLTALGSAGISPGRVFRPFVIMAILTGIGSFLITDQLQTRLGPLTDRVELAMNGKGDLRTDRARAAGWRSGSCVWSAATGSPANGFYHAVVAFRNDGGRRMLNARTLQWNDGAWVLGEVVVTEGDEQRRLATATPQELGFELRQDRDRLADSLRADESRTSGELRAAKSKRRHQVICQRVAIALLPLLCLLYGLPRFVVWNDRTRLGVVGFKSLIWGCVPLLGVGLLSKMLVSAGAQPVILAVGVMSGLVGFGILRWRRMRL